MPEPRFDRSTGWWNIRYIDASGSRRKVPLQRHPGWAKGQRPPKRPPPVVEQLARRYQDIAVQAKHGFDISPAKSTPIADFLASHRVVWSAGKQPSTHNAFDLAVEKFLAFAASARLATVQAVTPAHCRAFLALRRAEGKYESVKLDRAMLRPAWEAAVKDGLIPSNPWHYEKVPGKQRKERPDYWELDELARLLEACKPWERDMATVGVNTGLRAENLLELEWSEVKLATGHLEIPASKMKSGRPHRAPINPTALAVLDRLAKTREDRFVFGHPDGTLERPNHDHIKYRMTRARKKAGLPPKRSPVHILRHTFATHAAKTVPLPILQQWMGHSTITQTMVYVQVGEAESIRWMSGFSLSASPGTPPPPASDPS